MNIKNKKILITGATGGIGKAMVNQCIKYAQAEGCYKVILDCNEKNIPFYVKCGFIPASYCMRYNLDR